jgi:hypothetical protein
MGSFKTIFDYKHDYYCSNSNFYSNDPNYNWENWEHFYSEFHDSNIDMNLVFRFDLFLKNEDDDEEGYCLYIYMMHQRKGIFAPHIIESIKEENYQEIMEFLGKHFEKIKQIWEPFSLVK